MHPIAIIKGRNTPADLFDQSLSVFEDRQVFESAFHALQVLDEDPVNVVIIESNEQSLERSYLPVQVQ